MDRWSLRLARQEDAEAIAHVHVTTWRATYAGIVPQPYLDSLDQEQFAKQWQQWLAHAQAGSVFIAELGDRLCGFASGGPIRKPISFYKGELYAIYLLPMTQRQGIGRALFLRVADALAGQGMHNLLVWVLRHNPATEFYRTLGGELVAEDVIEIGGASLPEIAYGWSDHATATRR